MRIEAYTRVMSWMEGNRYILVVSSDRTQILHTVEYLVTLFLHREGSGFKRGGPIGNGKARLADEQGMEGDAVDGRNGMEATAKPPILPLIVITDIPPPGRLLSEDEYDELPEELSALKRRFSGEFGLYSLHILRGSYLQMNVWVPVLRVEVIRSFSKFQDVMGAITGDWAHPQRLEGVILFPVKGTALNLTLLRILQPIRHYVQHIRGRSERSQSEHIPWVVVGAYNARSMNLISICSESKKDIYSPSLRPNSGFPMTLGDSIRLFYSPSAELMASAALAFARGRRNPYELPVWGYACLEHGKLYEGIHELVYARSPVPREREVQEDRRKGRVRARIRGLSTHLCPKGRSQGEYSDRNSPDGQISEPEEKINGFLELDLELVEDDGHEEDGQGGPSLRAVTIVGPKIVRGLRDRMDVHALEKDGTLNVNQIVKNFVMIYIAWAKIVCILPSFKKYVRSDRKMRERIRTELIDCLVNNFDIMNWIKGLNEDSEIRKVIEELGKQIYEEWGRMGDEAETIDMKSLDRLLKRALRQLEKKIQPYYRGLLITYRRILSYYLRGGEIDENIIKEYMKASKYFSKLPNQSDPGFYLFKIMALTSPPPVISRESLSSLNTEYGGLGVFTIMPDDHALRGYLNCTVSRGVQWTWILKKPEKPESFRQANDSGAGHQIGEGEILELPCHSPRSWSKSPRYEERKSSPRRTLKMYVCFDDLGPGTLMSLLYNLDLGIREYFPTIRPPSIDLLLVREAPCPFGNHLVEFVGNINLMRKNTVLYLRVLPNQILVIEGPLLSDGSYTRRSKGSASSLSARRYVSELRDRLNQLAESQGYKYVIYSSGNGKIFLLRRIPLERRGGEDTSASKRYIPYCDFVIGCPFTKPEVKVFWKRE